MGISVPLPVALFDTLEYLAMESCLIPSHVNQDDYQKARAFILMYRGILDTFSAYRREIERLLQWTSLIVKKSFVELKRTDFENYLIFCQKPPKTWIGCTQVPRFLTKNGRRVPNPVWKPFVSDASKSSKNHKLSKKAFTQIFAISSSFFNLFIQEGIMELNPVLQIRQKNKYLSSSVTQPIIRRLSELQWSYVIESTELMAEKEPETHERTLFIMNLLYGMYLRISELAATDRWEPQMKDFYCDQDGNWWFKTVGKGNKQRQVAVSNAMLKALKRYRKCLELPPLPSPNEVRPLIQKRKSSDAMKSIRQIRSLVQSCFDAAVERMQAQGFSEEAQTLRHATVHWLRHTGISEDVKRRPREHVRDDAGHGSGAITDRYIDVELRERHASAKKKRINPERNE